MPIPYKQFRRELLVHYDKNKRNLPWRTTKDPYKIWLSEIILQQTRVDQGLPYYQRFIQQYPGIKELALASLDTVYKRWEGLGYYTRAANLHRTAQIIWKESNGIFPKTIKELQNLPGIGSYTAAAIASICFDVPVPVVDGNVVRLLSRVYNISDPFHSSRGKKNFNHLAKKLLDPLRPGDYNQAIMEFGAMVCRPHPDCTHCPIAKPCRARILKNQHLRPVKKTKKTKKKRHFSYFLICINDHIVIRQRHQNDIWKGLYELPYVECKHPQQKDIVLTSLKSWGISTTKRLKKLKFVREQKLSHQIITASFYKVSASKVHIKPSYKLVKAENLSTFAFPKVLNLFFTENNLILE